MEALSRSVVYHYIRIHVRWWSSIGFDSLKRVLKGNREAPDAMGSLLQGELSTTTLDSD